MIYRFGSFELDTVRFELRLDGAVRPLEPQVYAVLALLIENRERLISVDELIDKVWNGRPISDAAVSSRIRSARQALGDDGTRQQYIRTLPRRGFRFVAEVRAAREAEPTLLPVEPAARPSIAVLPFTLLAAPGPYATIADAVPHELISELARQRWLFVTARGSSFRFRGPEVDLAEAGRLLGVRYCLGGFVEIAGDRLTVAVELVDVRDGGVVWADRFSGAVDEVHDFRAQILARILAALEIRIPQHEADRARLSVSDSLDAWAAYHVGLQHMFRFNSRDNRAASELFGQALAQDPHFARACAGLSFVHFQTAFMGQADDPDGEIALARRYAERALDLDPLDPFVNFAMGRSYWLEGDLDTGLGWLQRATAISPNYAQGIYALAWTETLAGDTAQGRAHVDLAMQLSPIDPLHYAMLATRALTHLMQREYGDAARWANRAAHSPGAHVLIAMIAAAANALAGDEAQARAWARNVRKRDPRLGRENFFRAFPMRSAPHRAAIAAELARLGL
ncbi:MAG: winged helix-turn-helix domain-containing protein [Pseudomonadales bacterium]